MVDRPGTIGPHPIGAGTKWRAAGDSFFASRCKAEGGGKKLAADVAGSRARRRLHRRSSVRPDQSRPRWGWFAQSMRWSSRHGDHRTALSLARTDDGFAGSLAVQSPTLNVMAVAFAANSLQDDNEKGPAFRMVPSMHHCVRSRVEGKGPSDNGNPAASRWKAGRFRLPRLDWLGSEPDRDGRRGSCAGPLSPATLSPPWTGHCSRFVKAPAFFGEMAVAALSCVRD